VLKMMPMKLVVFMLSTTWRNIHITLMLMSVFGLDILCKDFRTEDLNQVTGKYIERN